MRRVVAAAVAVLALPYWGAAAEDDALGRLGFGVEAAPPFDAIRASLESWGVPAVLEGLVARAAARGSDSGASRRRTRAAAALRALATCARHENATDCITLAWPCAGVFGEMVHYAGGAGCAPVLGPSLAPAQAAAVVDKALGADAIFVWGGGGGGEAFGPLAARAYVAEHARPWCDCLRRRPLLRCLAKTTSVACTRHALDLKPFGRLTKDAQAAAKDAPQPLVAAHRRYVDAIAKTGERSFDAILVDGRAHASCALRALGFARADTAVFVNGWPRKFGPTVRRYYDVVRTIREDGAECGAHETRCLAHLAPKPDHVLNNETHTRHITRFKNFLRSPVNF